jgi:hypothetical protein
MNQSGIIGSRSINEAISAERKHREESEESLTRTLEEVVIKMQTDLENERKEREDSEETLLLIYTQNI